MSLRSYVSQDDWSDNDLEVECTVERLENGKVFETKFMCPDPFVALEKCRDNMENFVWREKE